VDWGVYGAPKTSQLEGRTMVTTLSYVPSQHLAFGPHILHLSLSHSQIPTEKPTTPMAAQISNAADASVHNERRRNNAMSRLHV